MTEATQKPRRTLDQRRANHAWHAVERLKQLKKDEAKEYAGEARKLPIRIIAAGLGQALAFILAKAKDKKKNLKQLHDDLTDWVIRERPTRSAARPQSLMESIVEGNTLFLRQATDEALAYLQWLNRFAEAEGLTEGEA